MHVSTEDTIQHAGTSAVVAPGSSADIHATVEARTAQIAESGDVADNPVSPPGRSALASKTAVHVRWAARRPIRGQGFRPADPLIRSTSSGISSRAEAQGQPPAAWIGAGSTIGQRLDPGFCCVFCPPSSPIVLTACTGGVARNLPTAKPPIFDPHPLRGDEPSALSMGVCDVDKQAVLWPVLGDELFPGWVAAVVSMAIRTDRACDPPSENI